MNAAGNGGGCNGAGARPLAGGSSRYTVYIPGRNSYWHITLDQEIPVDDLAGARKALEECDPEGCGYVYDNEGDPMQKRLLLEDLV